MIIEIAGQQWQVHKVESFHPGLMVEGTARRGACWCGRAEIFLSDELIGDQVARVVTHELVHAYIYSTQAVQPESWDEEAVCELFAIYALEIAAMCYAVCQDLYPNVTVRSYDKVLKEVRS